MTDLTRQPEYAALIDELARIAVDEHLCQQAELEPQSLPSPPQAA